MSDSQGKMTKQDDSKGHANELTNEILTLVPLNPWITKLTVLGTLTDNQTTQAKEQKINICHSNGFDFVPTDLTLGTNSQFYT